LDKLVVLSWSEFVEDVVNLAGKLRGVSLDCIVCISRGGLVAARLLSDLLGIKDILTLGISYYRGINERSEKPVVTSNLSGGVEGRRVLLVDDVADTGHTLRVALEEVRGSGAGGVVTCTVYIKPWCSYTPDYYSRVIDGWIVFPYEQAETIKELSKRNVDPEYLLRAGFNDKILSYVNESAKSKSSQA